MKTTQLILGVLLPPVAVYMTYGVSTTLITNILLTLLGWIPGSIHGAWAVAKYYEKLERQGTTY